MGQNRESTDQSASLIFAANGFDGGVIPIFHGRGGTGFILRPGVTQIRCGKGSDSGGHCGQRHWCPSESSVGDVSQFQYPGDGCGGSWRTEDFGIYLQRQTEWQLLNRRLEYNEIIYDGSGVHTNQDTVEAAFGNTEAIRHFLASHGMGPVSFVELDLTDWNQPFRCLGSSKKDCFD